MGTLPEGAAQLVITLNNVQIEQFQTCYQEICDWNRRINLTAITDLVDARTKHFLDSLTVGPAAAAVPEIKGTGGLGRGDHDDLRDGRHVVDAPECMGEDRLAGELDQRLWH